MAQPALDQRQPSALALRRLCDWAATYGAGLPEAIRRRAALVLLDDIGAAVCAAAEPEIVASRASSSGAGPAEATIFARGAPRVERTSAAVANGMAATWAELDEGYRFAPCHAGAYVWPALLAEAEAANATIGDVLRALALGYEVTTRLAKAFPFPQMTVHPHAAFATIGAAAGIGILRRLDGATLLGAVSGAASMAFAGPFNHAVDGALVRNAWTAAGAWIGFRSADWAVAGIGGIPETPHDVFVTALGTRCIPGELDGGLGENWGIADGYHKIFAACQYAHSMIEATLELRERLGVKAAGMITAIEIKTHPRGELLTSVDPANVLSSKFSMAHAAATVAMLGTGGQTAFSRQAMVDPKIAMLRRKVRLGPLDKVEPWPNDRASEVAWVLDDGSRHVAACKNARGGADNPFDEPTLLAKLADNTRADFPAMADVLAGILKGRADDAKPWRESVTAMTRE